VVDTKHAEKLPAVLSTPGRAERGANAEKDSKEDASLPFVRRHGVLAASAVRKDSFVTCRSLHGIGGQPTDMKERI